MISLSVNINKVATLRNARGTNTPDLLEVTRDLERFGAQGITIHLLTNVIFAMKMSMSFLVF